MPLLPAQSGPPPGTNPYRDPEVAVATAHHFYIQPDGLLRPMILGSYLVDPGHVLRTALEVIGDTQLQCVPDPTTEFGIPGAPAAGKELDFFCGNEMQSQRDEIVNLPASVVAVLCGRIMYPMRGLVAVIRKPDPDSDLRRKMTPVQKAGFRSMMKLASHVIAGTPEGHSYPKPSRDTVLSIAEAVLELDQQIGTLIADPVAAEALLQEPRS